MYEQIIYGESYAKGLKLSRIFKTNGSVLNFATDGKPV